jgi:hypothetical protein
MLIADVGPNAQRLALFEVSASVVQDQIHFSFLYNKKMAHQQEIKRWIIECQHTLEEIVQSLMGRSLEFSLADFPLLPLTYNGLEKITTKSLPQAGISPDMVECIVSHPMQ